MAQELTYWSTSKIILHSATKHTKAETHWARAKHVIAFHLHTNRYVEMGKENQLRFNPHTIRGLNEGRMFFIHRASIVVTGTCLHKISISILKNVEPCKNLKVSKVCQKDIRVLCLGDIRKKNSFMYEWNTRHGTSWIFYVIKLFNNTAAHICLFFFLSLLIFLELDNKSWVVHPPSCNAQSAVSVRCHHHTSHLTCGLYSLINGQSNALPNVLEFCRLPFTL